MNSQATGSASPVATPDGDQPSRQGNRSWRWSLGLGLLMLAALAIIPVTQDPLLLILWTSVLMYSALAQAWNIIGGFTGYAAFGNVVFFGIGAYSMALALQHGMSLWTGLLLGAVVAVAFAVVLGLPVLRLKGHYFAIATLGVTVALGQFVEVESIGGAADSVSIRPPDMGSLDPNTVYFYAFLVLSLILLLGTTWLTQTRFGYALVAIRENEQAAEALGIPTYRYKVAAFALSAAPTALAGGLFALWQGTISPTGESGVFDPGYSVAMVLMTFLGGAGTILGPLVGGVIVQYLENVTLISFNAIHGPLLGALIILVTIFLPQGLVRLSQELFRAPLALDGPEAARVSYVHRIGEGVRRVVRFVGSQGV